MAWKYDIKNQKISKKGWNQIYAAGSIDFVQIDRSLYVK